MNLFISSLPQMIEEVTEEQCRSLSAPGSIGPVAEGESVLCALPVDLLKLAALIERHRRESVELTAQSLSASNRSKEEAIAFLRQAGMEHHTFVFLTNVFIHELRHYVEQEHGNVCTRQLHIRLHDGEIVITSSEDRLWGLAQQMLGGRGVGE